LNHPVYGIITARVWVYFENVSFTAFGQVPSLPVFNLYN